MRAQKMEVIALENVNGDEQNKPPSLQVQHQEGFSHKDLSNKDLCDHM